MSRLILNGAAYINLGMKPKSVNANATENAMEAVRAQV